MLTAVPPGLRRVTQCRETCSNTVRPQEAEQEQRAARGLLRSAHSSRSRQRFREIRDSSGGPTDSGSEQIGVQALSQTSQLSNHWISEPMNNIEPSGDRGRQQVRPPTPLRSFSDPQTKPSYQVGICESPCGKIFKIFPDSSSSACPNKPTTQPLDFRTN